MKEKLCKWKCDGCRTVKALNDGSFSAGEHFALIKARRAYGRRACVGALRLDSWSEDGRFSYYQAFIGLAQRGGSIVGHNIMFVIEFEGGRHEDQ